MNHLEIYNIIYHTTLITAAILITYPLWSLKFQKNYIISLSWFVATFVILIFFGSLLVISSSFDQLHNCNDIQVASYFTTYDRYVC